MKEYIMNLTLSEYKIFRDLVLKKTGVTPESFRNWKYGAPVSPKYHRTINAIGLYVKKQKVFNNSK